MDTKICTWCHQELPLSEFPIRDSAKGTYRANCKKCHSEYMKKKYREKKDALHEYKQELIDDLYYAQCPKCHKSDPYEFLGCSRKRTIENWNRYMEKRYDADDDL